MKHPSARMALVATGPSVGMTLSIRIMSHVSPRWMAATTSAPSSKVRESTPAPSQRRLTKDRIIFWSSTIKISRLRVVAATVGAGAGIKRGSLWPRRTRGGSWSSESASELSALVPRTDCAKLCRRVLTECKRLSPASGSDTRGARVRPASDKAPLRCGGRSDEVPAAKTPVGGEALSKVKMSGSESDEGRDSVDARGRDSMDNLCATSSDEKRNSTGAPIEVSEARSLF
mmetsp:Transcript_1929/g.5765  ORF Transcript_1929/g.5765 Transcript_1929/m.5765 type:complete len:230 (-) Transcript_1929:4380-5069(-)